MIGAALRMPKSVVFGSLVLFGSLIASAQDLAKNSSQQPLSVGDKIPDWEINNIINYSSSSARFSGFRNKLLLIDFWGTTCSSCIAALPKIDSLQKIYKDKIQVLTVTNYDSKEKVTETLQRYKQTQHLSLPIVLNDSKLKKLFPHEIVSHVVWIDGSGTVKAITGTEYINGKNIQALIDKREINWPVKNDVFDFDYEKPFLSFSNESRVQPAFLYSAAFTAYIDGIDGTDKQFIDPEKQTITRNYFNKSLLQLCDGSLKGSGTGYINPKHLVLQVKDATRYIRDEDAQYYTDWAKKNTYCYSITLPLHVSEEKTKEMISADLTHWLQVLGVTIKKEKRLTNCFLLVRTKQDDDLLRTKGGDYEYGLNEQGTRKYLSNSPFSNVTWHLNEETPGIPWVFDETGIRADLKVDMEFSINSFQDINGFRQELQQYGLDLIAAKREMEMYIITD